MPCNPPVTTAGPPVPGAPAALAATGLACGYGAGTVLRGVTLRLAPGEMVALLGRNGCGTSTVLRCLSGVLPPQAGTVTLLGVALAQLPRQTVARLLAVVAQELHVPFGFSVRAVVDLGRAPYARFLQPRGGDDRQAVDRALAATTLQELADRPCQQLSGGEQQRTAVALALAQEPRVLLLDEPTVHLDIAPQIGILALIRSLCVACGRAVLACLSCDRLLILGAGTLHASGTPDALVSAAVSERAFGTCGAVGRHPHLDVPQVSLWP